MSASPARAKASPKSAKDVALYRSIKGLAIASRLQKAAELAGSLRARKTAEKIRACADQRNIWEAQDLHSTDGGELYEGMGTLFACGSRFCPSCSAGLRRRARKRLLEAFDSLNGRGEVPKWWPTLRWRFLTLTGPRDGVNLEKKMEVYQYAWSLLRKKKFWKDLMVEAGCKGGEFTVTEDGYHFHFHLLIFSKWIGKEAAAIAWTECLSRAYQEKVGQQVAVTTMSGLCVVDVRAVKSKVAGLMSTPTAVSLQSAIQEVLKYVTKSDSWLKVSDAELVKLAEIPRWPRLFEIFGNSCRKVGTSRSRTSLDTSALSDGKTAGKIPSGYRQNLENLSFEDWKNLFLRKIAGIRDFRRQFLAAKFPYATFRDLTGRSWGVLSEPWPLISLVGGDRE